MNRSILLFFVVLICFTAAGYGLVEVFERTTPLEIYGPENHTIGSFTLTDQNNQSFNTNNYNGRIWIVNCFFTSCPIVCPKVMKNLQEVHDLLRNDESLLMMSMTVDPTRDTPEVLFKFANKYNVSHDAWFLLTGEKKELYRLARKEFLLSAADGTGDKSDFIHSENIVVIDPERRIRNIINGTAPNANLMVLESVKKLKKEYNL